MIPAGEESPSDYWIVEVRELADLSAGIAGYTKRFEFRGEDAPLRAWTCWAEATRHGMKATAERVRDYKMASQP